MMDSTRTQPSNSPSLSAIRCAIYALPVTALLAWCTGCQSLVGVPGANAGTAHSSPPPTTSFSLPSDTAGNELAASDRLQTADSGSTPTSESDRYVARQYPSNYTLPPPIAGQPNYGDPSVYSIQPGAPATGYGSVPTYPSQPTYSTPPTYATPPSYGSAPGPAISPVPDSLSTYPGTPPGVPGLDVYSQPTVGLPPLILPETRTADLIINGYPARTGRIMFGGAVNSDAGVTGQITVDERNFDITRFPRSFQDLFSGTAFRGAGQTFRLEAVPGSQFQRYTAQFADPNLFGYLPISMSVSGFLFDRRFNDWDEERLGGRLSFGYRVTPDLSVAVGISGQSVDVSRIRSPLGEVPLLDAAMGANNLFSGEAKLIHDTRDSPIQASQGHYFEAKFEQVFGDFDYSRFETEFRTYFLISERADRSGKQTLSYSTKVGYSGDETPIFENFFAGGYATIRGFNFRGASPAVPTSVGNVEVGGRFQWLNTVEYMFPITADDAFRGVAFVDFGTVELDAKLRKDDFRVAPGVGLRVAIPMLGPAPLAFDFAFPVAMADTDQKRIFSFYMSLVR